ncbi:hypothetical protein BDP27DRAFT_1339944 [Rhodocollybia butyracea]|uniref:Uncharacterized protein n=1 Tax=Rhodocollybia butyracea TaxID=206335 RepID=A0A9P5PDR9_9AGAR|nr:hypothetical protein BDP27DRAFT_1339944 [Rhodocollybia butyracea]
MTLPWPSSTQLLGGRILSTAYTDVLCGVIVYVDSVVSLDSKRESGMYLLSFVDISAHGDRYLQTLCVMRRSWVLGWALALRGSPARRSMRRPRTGGYRLSGLGEVYSEMNIFEPMGFVMSPPKIERHIHTKWQLILCADADSTHHMARDLRQQPANIVNDNDMFYMMMMG